MFLFSGKPLHSTLQENVQNIDENKIEEANKPEKEKKKLEKLEKENEEKEMEEDDEEIVIKRPKTPLSNRNRRLTIETPEVDLERFRPQRFNLDATNPLVSIITLKVRKSRNVFFKPTILQKRDEKKMPFFILVFF